jgi:hypothetical protein
MTVGFVAVGLAAVGLFVPLLPSTPFLLLAAACFMRSSDRFYRWLMTHPIFGAYIRNYREHRAITRQAKVVTLLLLWVTVGYSALVVFDTWYVQVTPVAIALGVTIHILKLKTMTPALSQKNRAGGSDLPAQITPPG